MSEGSPTGHAAPRHIRSIGQASFVLGICGLTLGGCWVMLVVLQPDVVDLIGPLGQRPYAIAGAVGLVFGLPAIVLGAVGWHGSRKRTLESPVPMAGCILGIVTVVFSLVLAAIDVQNGVMR